MGPIKFQDQGIWCTWLWIENLPNDINCPFTMFQPKPHMGRPKFLCHKQKRNICGSPNYLAANFIISHQAPLFSIRRVYLANDKSTSATEKELMLGQKIHFSNNIPLIWQTKKTKQNKHILHVYTKQHLSPDIFLSLIFKVEAYTRKEYTVLVKNKSRTPVGIRHFPAIFTTCTTGISTMCSGFWGQ